MNSFVTKYIIAIIIIAAIMVAFRDPEVTATLQSLLGCILLLAFIEVSEAFLKK